MNDILIDRLRDGRHSLVIGHGGVIHTFDGRGIADLYRLLHDGRSLLCGASVADKVVGKGAAALMALGGVSELFAEVISTSALSMLTECGIPVGFGREVPHVINRQGDGICPVERLCQACATPEECLPLIEKFMSSKL